MRKPIRSAAAGRSPRAVAALLAAVALTAIAGCGGSGRDYTVPASLCGVPVRSAGLAPLMPNGDSIEQDRHASSPGAPRCHVFVDHNEVLLTTGDFTETTTDPFKVNETALLESGHPAPVHGIGDRAVLADSEALAVKACTHQGRRMNYVIELSLATDTPEKTAERRSAALTFFRGYVPSAAKKAGC